MKAHAIVLGGVIVAALVGAAAPARADALGAHLECFVGTETRPVVKRKKITRDLTCTIRIDSGDPPVSARAKVVIAQDGAPVDGRVLSSEQPVPADVGDWSYYPFDAFQLRSDFRPCKDFTVWGKIVDGDAVLWKGSLAIQTQCAKAKRVPARLECHVDLPDGSQLSYPGNGAKTQPKLTSDLVCRIHVAPKLRKQVQYLHGLLRMQGSDKPASRTAIEDFPDDTMGVEATYGTSDYHPCSGFIVEGAIETPDGQVAWTGTVTVEQQCP